MKLCRNQNDADHWDCDLLRAVVRSTPDILFFKNTEGVYLGCNDLFAEFVGVPTDRLPGKTDFDLFPQPVADSFRANDALMLASGEPRHNEEWITYPDGRDVLVDTLKAPLRDTEGRLLGLMGVSRDITSRKLGEERLRESEANFRMFFETLSDLVVVATPEGRILFANTALKQKLGYTQDELETLHILDLHPPAVRPEAEQVFGAMLRGERTNCPLPLAAKSGALLPVDTRIWIGKWSGTGCIFGLCKDLSAEQDALQRFERLFRNNPNSMALSEISSRRFIDVNDAFLRTTGYTRAEVLGKTSASLGLFIDAGLSASIDERIAKDQRFSDVEIRIRAKDGTLMDGRLSGETITSQDCTFLLTVFVDITPYKQITAALARERERLDGILEATRVGTWEWDVQTGKTEFNARWAELLGYTLDELGPTSVDTWQRLTHPDDLALARTLLERHFCGEADFYECEQRMRHKSGEWVWILDRGRLCSRTPDGQPLLMRGTHQDITTRKRAELQAERLSEIQHQLMHLATEFVNVPIEYQDDAIQQALTTIGGLIRADRAYLFEYDYPAGVMNNTHEWCAPGVEPQLESLQQCPLSLFPEWLRAHEAGNLVHIPLVERLDRQDPLWQVLAPQGIQSLITLPLVSPGGALGFVGFDAVAAPRDWSAEEIALLRVLAELFANFKMKRLAEQERHDLQRRLEAARDEAQSALKAKGLFLANMSHEIRTPLNAILGYAQLMRLKRSEAHEYRQAVETILKSGQHLLDLLNGILLSAQNDSALDRAETAPFNFHALLSDTVSLFTHQLRERPLTLAATWSDEVPCRLRSDRAKIRQVLINLIGNAAKFTTRGAIRVRAERLPATDSRHTPTFALRVSDTGSGISPDFLPHLFEPFQQEAGRVQGSETGIGLGLPISRRIARALGGDLTVASNSDQGCEFLFTFTAEADDRQGAETEELFITRLAAGQPPLRILVADDDPANRQMLHDLLAAAGFLPVTATSGQEVLRLLCGSEPDPAPALALLDLRMPDMDGEETLRQLRACPECARIPVLFVTAADAGDLRAETRESLADGFVTKPLRRSQLLLEIQRLTGVRYEYERLLDPTAADKGPEIRPLTLFQRLPEELSTGFLAAIRRGDTAALRTDLVRIRSHSPSLADHLDPFVASYNYKGLKALLTET